jgi:hypothetical protein
MKLALLTNAAVVDGAIRLLLSKFKDKRRSRNQLVAMKMTKKNHKNLTMMMTKIS